MRLQILQHSPETPPGTVTEWAQLKGHKVSITHLYKGETLPSLDSFDFLIVLGGGMNVDETEAHPWLATEKEFLKQALAAHKTCLGLCLGGQLLSQVLGGKVRKHDHWEVGWHTVHIGSDLRLHVFQWHQDTFEIPPGAVRVATNRTTENQAFAYGDFAVGVQFHPEATEEWIRQLLEEKEYPTGAHVQTPEHILEDLIFLQPMKKWFFDLLDRMESITKARQQSEAEAVAAQGSR